jgi:hypothetical protein
MSKNILQDIVKKDTRRTEINQKKIIYSDIKNNFSPSVNTTNLKIEKNKSFNSLWVVVLISIVFLFFGISFLFTKAIVIVEPKTKDFALDKAFFAKKGTSDEGLSYDLVVLSGEEKREVAGGEEKDYLEYAKGSVLIYNSFSSNPQSLAANSKLLGSNGKIYKTKTKVLIPGMSKTKLPGKIGVEIVGLEAGEEYNSSPIDFNILGFKDTTKYTKFNVRSVGEITGGLKGKSRQISEVEKEKIKGELKDSLLVKLFNQAKEQTPPNFILFKDANFLNLEDLSVIPSTTEGNFVLSIKGTFNGILLNREKLTKEIINISQDKDDDKNVYVLNIDNLVFSNTNKDLAVFDETGSISFSLLGNVKIVWNIDEAKLKSDFIGKNKKDFNQTLSQYLNINSANLVIKPFWENSFPSKDSKIQIIVNYPK